MKFAWIKTSDSLYVAKGLDPVRYLIEGIYDLESKKMERPQAKKILRESIHTSFTPSFLDREMIRVTAKRVGKINITPPILLEGVHPEEYVSFGEDSIPAIVFTSSPKVENFGSLEFRGEMISKGDLVSEEKIPEVLITILETDPTRKVSALLIDKDSRVLEWAWNTNSLIKTRHAEWNLCDGLLSEGEKPGGSHSLSKIPVGAKLWVSLKPCRMCAARIWSMAENPSKIEVIFLENDPGPLAQGTLLDVNSPARRRFLGAKDSMMGVVNQRQWVSE